MISQGGLDSGVSRHRSPFSLICISMVFYPVYLRFLVYVIVTSRFALSSFSKTSAPECSNPLHRISRLRGAFKFATVDYVL